MGSVVGQPVVMQFLIATSLFASAAAQLVVYPNGAVAPFDPANAAATKEHFAALSEAGANVNPYFTHAQDLAVPAPVVYAGYPYGLYGRKKRSADPQTLGADGLVTYPNGAIAPFDPNVALATAAHFQAKAAQGSWFPLEGAANVHPAAVPAYPYGIYGRKKREADAQVLLAGPYGAYPYAGYGYAGLPYGLPFTPLVGHPNGAVVPLEPAAVVKARAEHLAAVAEAGRKKREAEPQVLLAGAYGAYGAYPYAGYGYAGLPYALPFTPLVGHPNGAVVPLEPADVVKA